MEELIDQQALKATLDSYPQTRQLKNVRQLLTTERDRVEIISTDPFLMMILGKAELRQYWIEFDDETGWKCDCPSLVECYHILAGKVLVDCATVKRAVTVQLDDWINQLIKENFK